MSLLYAVVFASRCRSNHHRLALDALRHLRAPRAAGWRDFFLCNHGDYLKGAKAPDDEFKDFKNHVLHVRDNNWGGAIEACEEWYRRTVRAMKAKDWRQVAWSAGVLSHYYVDPIQPFHTHQTEEENVIHRAVEWSFSKSYRSFQAILENDLGGYPEIEVPSGEKWLAEMVLAGARASNPHYELIVEHYDFAKGVADPPAGLDQELKDTVAKLVGHAAVGFARILDRAIEEAHVKPPRVDASLETVFVSLQAPIQALLKSIDDAGARREVAAQYAEYQRTGKVRSSLGEDDKVVRALYAEEVLKTPLSSLDAKWPKEIGAKAGEGAPARSTSRKSAKPAPKVAPKAIPTRATLKPLAPMPPAPPPTPPVAPTAASKLVEAPPSAAAKPVRPRKESRVPRELPIGAPRAKQEKALPKYLLEARAPVEKAPSIGPKTARRLEAVGVRTVGDLIAASAEVKHKEIGARHITAQVFSDWQAQARLACTVPGLKSREAQALTACGVRDADGLARADAVVLCDAIGPWGLSEEGQRAWGAAPAPNEDDVQTWIARAQRALKSQPPAAASARETVAA